MVEYADSVGVGDAGRSSTALYPSCKDSGNLGGAGRLRTDARPASDGTGNVGKAGRGGKSSEAGGRGRGGGSGGVVASADADGAGGVCGRLLLVTEWRLAIDDDEEHVELRNANAPTSNDLTLPLDVLHGFGGVGGSGSLFGVATTGTSDCELAWLIAGSNVGGGGGNTASSSTSEPDARGDISFSGGGGGSFFGVVATEGDGLADPALGVIDGGGGGNSECCSTSEADVSFSGGS